LLAWGSTFFLSTRFEGWRWDASLIEGTLDVDFRPWAARELIHLANPEELWSRMGPPAGLYVERPHSTAYFCTGPAEFSAWSAVRFRWPSIDRGEYYPDDEGDSALPGEHVLYQYSVRIPLAPIVLLVAIPTGFAWWRERRSIPPGHCRQCGYDLTGNLSGQCSECGLMIATKPGAEQACGDPREASQHDVSTVSSD
jgi:hypothetical protein